MNDSECQFRQANVTALVLFVQEGRKVFLAHVVFLQRCHTHRDANLFLYVRIMLLEKLHECTDIALPAKILGLDAFQAQVVRHFQLAIDGLQVVLDTV